MTTQPAHFVTAHIHRDDAVRLVGLAGGERDAKGRYVVNGRTYWHLEEAVRYAITEISAANGIEI